MTTLNKKTITTIDKLNVHDTLKYYIHVLNRRIVVSALFTTLLVIFLLVTFFLKAFRNNTSIYLGIIIIFFFLLFHIYRLKSDLKTLKKIIISDSEENDNFFANINHELRTPLHIILGMNEMIMRESITPNVNEYALNSHKAAEHLMTLINKLMMYSKLGHEKISPINVQFSLPILIDTYIIGFKKLCTHKGISFTTNVSANVPHDLIGDNILLRQIIYHLTNNFILITESKAITTNIYWDNINDTQGILHFDISIPDVVIDDNDLDLKTVTDIVDIMQGTLKITKNDASGTQIKVYMPFASKQDEIDIASDSYHYNTKSSSYVAPNAKILIVDDTEMNIKVFSLLLKRTRITVDSALNGNDALKLLEKKKYDLIFIDYMMPDINGAQLYDKIKVKFPDVINETPIFVISANTAADTRDKLLSQGFTGYLPKPIESSTLDFIIRHNLPKELISTCEESTNVLLLNPDYTEFDSELINFDINLTEGLKYMNDDIVQYANVAELIVKNYQKTLDRILALHENGNIKDLGISVHALKGNAKYIGATTLYNITQTMESKATLEEVAFITNALPLLCYEWEKVINGLALFLDKYNNSKYAISTTDTASNINTDSYLEQLIDYVDELHPEPAIRLIEQVIKQNIAPEQESKLKQISDYLEDFEYDEAMYILKEISQCSKDHD